MKAWREMSFSDLIAMKNEMLRYGEPKARDYLIEHFNEDKSPKFPEEIDVRNKWRKKLNTIIGEIKFRLYE